MTGTHTMKMSAWEEIDSSPFENFDWIASSQLNWSPTENLVKSHVMYFLPTPTASESNPITASFWIGQSRAKIPTPEGIDYSSPESVTKMSIPSDSKPAAVNKADWAAQSPSSWEGIDALNPTWEGIDALSPLKPRILFLNEVSPI
jgi:hypothetical protein